MTPVILNWILIGIIGVSMLIGFMRGFLPTLVSTIVWLIAVFSAILLNDWLAWFISKLSFLASVSNLIAGVVVLVLILIVGHVIVKVFNFIGDISRVGMSSRLIAVLIGVVRGVLCVVALVFVLNMTAVSARVWWSGSQMVQGITPWVEMIYHIPTSQTGLPQQPGVHRKKSQPHSIRQSQYPKGSL